MAGTASGVAVVVVPLPAQGHLNQLLHLARLLSGRGIPVHYVSSASHIRQARERVHCWDPDASLHAVFHHLPLPPFPSPDPNPNSTSNFPSHLQPAFDAALHLRSPLSSLLRSLAASYRRVVVVHDSLMSFAADAAASLPSAESYAFHSCSALASLFFQWESRGRPLEPWVDRLGLSSLSLDGCFTDEFTDFIRRQHRMTATVSGRLFNTCRAIEGEFIDLHARDPRWRGQRLFAVGPLNPVAAVGGERRQKCLAWLDRQPPASVVYVSFGTTSSLSEEQVRELAAGLARSDQRFIWVLRGADRADIYSGGGDGEKPMAEMLPRGYEREVEGVGMVVREWAPQLEILAHAATGAFVSHCGWNSCVESMSMGVAMVAWPMHSDQPRNALLVTEVLGAGVAVRDWEDRTSVLPAAALREAIVGVMAGEGGKEVRKRAKWVGEALRNAVADGGTSRAALDEFIAHITR